MDATRPTRRFEVIDGNAARTREDHEAIRLDVDVEVQEDSLRDMIQRPFAGEDMDLILLAGVVARVDRMVVRRLSEGWARSLHVVMRVHEPDRWRGPKVGAALSRCLRILTGDEWTFEFEPRAARDQHVQMALLRKPPERVVALAYSGGLDSYCGAADWSPDPDATPLLVHTKNSQTKRQLVEATVRGRGLMHVSMPLHLPKLSHPEPSYRTRTFTFLVVAAVAARSGGGSEVLISENGQGALGPALVRFNGEHPYLSTHPVFTRALAEFLTLAWAEAHRVNFVHPAVLKTKGEVLGGLVKRNVVPHWGSTRSCSRSIPRRFGSGMPDQCGLCGGCLLRRLALHTAGVGRFGSDVEGYLWADLGAEEFDGIASRQCEWSHGDQELAIHAIIDLASLAEFAARPDDDPDILTLVEDLEVGLGRSASECNDGVRRLLGAHRAEWADALSALPASAWLRRIAAGRI